MEALKLLLIVLSVCEACRSSVKPADTTQTVPPANVMTAPIVSLTAPKPTHVTILEGGRVIIAWDPVKVNEDNPILGFKIKLWEPEKHKVYKATVVNGTSILTEEWVPVEKSAYEVPTHKPAFEAVLPPDALKTTFVVKTGVEYELRGQSYNADGDGPLSNAVTFEIHSQ